jgi:hypothetical protein
MARGSRKAFTVAAKTRFSGEPFMRPGRITMDGNDSPPLEGSCEKIEIKFEAV